MATTAALLTALAQAMRQLAANLEAKGVSTAGISSFCTLAELVLEIPSSLPACSVPVESLSIPEGVFSPYLQKLWQAREALRQNLGAKGIDVTGITALSALVAQVLNLYSGAPEMVPVSILHVNWTQASGADEYSGAIYSSYLSMDGSEWIELPPVAGQEPNSMCTAWLPGATQIHAEEGGWLYLFPGSYQFAVQLQLPDSIEELSLQMTVTLYAQDGSAAASQRIENFPLTAGSIHTVTFDTLTVQTEGLYRLSLEEEAPLVENPSLNMYLSVYDIELCRFDESTAAYANIAALESAIQSASQCAPGDYTDFSAVEAALAMAVALSAARPKAQSQALVDQTAQTLMDAIDALVLAADLTALQNAINEVRKYPLEDALDASAVTAARDAGQALLDTKPSAAQQAEVDAAAQAILNALAALQWKEGALRNPIPYKAMMSVTEGLYYSYNGNVYRCKQSASICLVLPGTLSSWWEKAD